MKIESTLKKYKGFIELPDFLTIKQVRAFEDAYFGKETPDAEKSAFISVSVERLIPFLRDNVKEWKIDGMPVDIEEYPYKVLRWAAMSFILLWQDEINIPNE